MDNIEGIFPVELGGVKREVKVTFGLVERLERRVLNRPLTDILREAAGGRFFVSEMAATIYEGLVENGDKRLTYDQVGSEVMKNGASNYSVLFVQMISFALTGGVKTDSSRAGAELEKKS